MAANALRSEERIGLGVALAAHVALFAWLALTKPAAPLPPPERMTVTLSDEVGLTATSPNPAPEAAPDTGPELGEPAPEPEPLAKVEPAKPEPVAQKQAVAPPKTTSVAKVPAPPVKTPPKQQQQQQAARQQTTPVKGPKPPAKSGASSFDQAFGKGTPNAQGKNQTTAPTAPAFGPQQQSALRSAIFRQLKPHWTSPQGIDVEKLVTVVRFKLDRNGRLIGEPVIVSQTGQTPANAPQVKRHGEQAIRAVKLAQPFILPPDLYPYWQTVTSTFDRRLSQ